MINRVWNGKTMGLPIALYLLCTIFISKVFDLFSSALWCKNFGSCGKGCTVQYGVIIRHPKNIKLSSFVHIGRYVYLGAEIEGTLELSENVQINARSHIDFSGGVVVREGATISEGVMIQSHSHGISPRSKPRGYSLDIGKGVWIGAKATILHNVRSIGDGSIIAAGSVVTKPVPKGVVVAGNPAKIIRHLEG